MASIIIYLRRFINLMRRTTIPHSSLLTPNYYSVFTKG
jgi:hypothetical protein